MSICPRLRPVEIFPTQVDGQTVLCLRDPSGLSDHLALVAPQAAIVLSLCDGSRTHSEVAQAFRRLTGAHIDEAQTRELLERLDEGLFLDSPRFHAHRAGLIEAFHAAPRREAAHAGKSYPDDPGSLGELLDAHLATAGSVPPATGGIVAPHIDFPRGGAVYGKAYAALGAAGKAPDLVVVFGTDHVAEKQPLTLTAKAYETPLGAVETDDQLCSALARTLGRQLFTDELHHRGEHSIEFQAVWLRHVYGSRTPPILPVLCGSLSRPPGDEPFVREFVSTLRRLTSDRRVVVVAGADLAHVGPRFGDEPFGPNDCAMMKAADLAALTCIENVDAQGFWNKIMCDGDRYRICGLAPISLALSFLQGPDARGELLGYEQCPADEGPTSFVSIAALAMS